MRDDARTDGAPVASLLETLVALSRTVAVLLDLRLAGIGLTRAEARTILCLGRSTPKDMAALLFELGQRPSSILRTLDRLEASDLIAAHPLKGHVLTPAGAEKQKDVENVQSQVEVEIMGDIGQDRLQGLRSELDLLVSRLLDSIRPLG